VLLVDQLAQKENELREEIESKVQNHRRWNQNHIDLTRDPLSPVKEQGTELKFRPAKTQYLMTPPASISSEEMDVDEVAAEAMDIDKPQQLPVFQFKAGGVSHDHAQTNQPSFRRRIGRLQRLWIDRRGLATPPRQESSDYSDRWKYDSDDDDVDPPVYELDPYDTRALKFRATIPLSPFIFRGGQRPPINADATHAAAVAAAAAAAGNRALPQPPQVAAQAQAAS
jgi:enhancer of polycomb-like protein